MKKQRQMMDDWDEQVIYSYAKTEHEMHQQRGRIQYFLKETNVPLEGEYFNPSTQSSTWYLNGFLHRDEIDPKTGLSLPAILGPFGQAWYKNGYRHREDGPAVVVHNEEKTWYAYGSYHRLNGPAYEDEAGNKQYWIEGKHHRLDGPATENADGTKEYFVNGLPAPWLETILKEKELLNSTTEMGPKQTKKI